MGEKQDSRSLLMVIRTEKIAAVEGIFLVRFLESVSITQEMSPTADAMEVIPEGHRNIDQCHLN